MKEFYLAQFEEEAWNKFVNAYQIIDYMKIDENLKEEISKLGLPNDIQIVLLCKLGGYTVEWINKNVPVLENEKPIDYLRTTDGTSALKAAIMRMPD
ncbi:hypothetical protein [Paenibacillus wynnii]|uniref:Antitoxin Xre/MbcA/ParS-like toxin-binding domain-containing protein n=1 Tax=Paenibacillus wynnii TaxID=268407 RepID=A0A098MA51_9BACL|nr:hypothetical protein [Paenibacillus wynnii]KGE18412.1 hypothetical protein PWYN_28325 [Paenibacillus wynnii]